MDPESAILSESYLFEARKATSGSPSSYYSSRIHALMMLKIESGKSELDAEIEASKTHWTEVESNRYYTPATSAREESSTSETGVESCGMEMTEEEWAELYKENVEEMERLQMEYKDSAFFRIGGKVRGKIIGKGGQATIYEDWDDTGDQLVSWVWKVFEAGYYVRELRKQWPIDLHRDFLEEKTLDDVRRIIFRGRLLDDGRFAFGMLRLWGDLRKLLDVRMQHHGNRYPPFMMKDGSYQDFYIMSLWVSIAVEMKALHHESTLHRDLKASNVLIEADKFLATFKEEDRINPLEIDNEFMCVVADYECSIGVVGTGFWRAPEIMEALKNRSLDIVSNAFTPKADVYGYAMTCYEILTGYVPFEHREDEGTNIDHVLQGKRPTLPQYLKPWVMDLFHKCWHSDPSLRPTFIEILEILKSNILSHPIFESIAFREENT